MQKRSNYSSFLTQKSIDDYELLNMNNDMFVCLVCNKTNNLD